MVDFAGFFADLWELITGFFSPRSQSFPPLTCEGGMKVGLTAFGLPSRFNLLESLHEFKSYIEDNSRVKLDIHFVQADNLPGEEIPLYDASRGCCMVTPHGLSTQSRGKMPSGMKTDIVVYDTMEKEKCVIGLQWGFAVPFICVPYSNSSNWDYGWKTSLAPALVHEFTHALYSILNKKGYTDLPDIDKANDQGYTLENDPGWLRYRKHCLELITQEMADILMSE